MYKFIQVRYKLHPKVNKYEVGWFLLLDSQQSFNLFINKRSKDLTTRYLHLKENISPGDPFSYKNGGHMSNREEITLSLILALDGTRKTIIDDCSHLDRLLLGYLNIFNDKGHVLVNCNYGCGFMDSSFQILDTIVKKELVFPIKEPSCSIKQWPGGKHYYIRIGNFDLDEKFNTYEAAEEYSKLWIKK